MSDRMQSTNLAPDGVVTYSGAVTFQPLSASNLSSIGA
jgi:hypothetical protein